jgi:hypothetical protein
MQRTERPDNVHADDLLILDYEDCCRVQEKTTSLSVTWQSVPVFIQGIG